MNKTIRLVYFSKAQRDMTLEDIQSILNTARTNNAEVEACGMLCYESRWFLQVLEGDRATISELFIDIADDPRHDEVVIVSMDYVDEPKFRDWQMGYAASSEYFEQAMRECALTEFDPEEMTAELCLELLVRLSNAQEESQAA